MRHKKNKFFGLKIGNKKNVLSNMACSLIKYKRINTTLLKAKELRRFIEPLITKSKKNDMHSQRIIFSYLKNKFATSHLFTNISPKIIERPGGYTRIIKIGYRLGDGAKTAIIEIIL